MKSILCLLLSAAALLSGTGVPAAESASPPAQAEEVYSQDWVADYLGEWVLWDDGCSTLNVAEYGSDGIRFTVNFHNIAAFTVRASLSDSKVAFFAGTDTPSFAGEIVFGDDSITLYTFNDLWIVDGWFDSRVFTFRRPADPGVKLTHDELEAAISAIRDAFYSPTPSDARVALPKDEQGYYKDFTYHNGEPIFAFVYNGTEEYRFYYLNDRLIRYIDENHVTFDLENVLLYTRWAQEILQEGWENAPEPKSVEIPDWVGTWAAEGGETLEIISAGEDSITLIYNGYTASGTSMFHSEYTMPYDNSGKISASEPYTVLLTAGWRYSVLYQEDHITLSSRYPIKVFYRQ